MLLMGILFYFTQLGEALRQIEKAYPDTPATMEAKLLGKRWINTNAD